MGTEQESDHIIMAGYKKGALTVGYNLVFTINERSQSEFMQPSSRPAIIMVMHYTYYNHNRRII